MLIMVLKLSTYAQTSFYEWLGIAEPCVAECVWYRLNYP